MFQPNKSDLGHLAKKQFGQNFLSDHYYLDKIVGVMAPSSNDHLVEIGPGQGALTAELLAHHPKSLTVIELDRDLIPYLKHSFVDSELTIVEADALCFDYTSLRPLEGKLKVLGNLPYNISTPLLFHLAQYSDLIEEMVFLLQKEVVDRICASSGTPAYGRLSIMLQAQFTVRAYLDVPPDAFSPPPKVRSSVVRLVPSQQYQVYDWQILNKLTVKAFSFRRKMIKKVLQGFVSDLEPFSDWLTLRPEEIPVEDFVKMANLIYTKEKDQQG